MILHAPGYNLTRRREPARAATGRRFVTTTAPRRADPASPPLRALCTGVEILAVSGGGLDRRVGDLCIDSRRVSPGSLFFALPGEQTDGSFYIEEALDRGAVAIITEKARPERPGATVIQVGNARAALASVSRRFFGFSVSSLGLIGVTGSQGKTCVAHLVQHLLNGSEPVGLLSSIRYDLGSRRVPSYRNTPEALDLYGMLGQIVEHGCRRAVLEISSLGIEQKRVAGLLVDVAVFLNSGAEPEGFHGRPRASFAAKKSIFTGAQGHVPRAAVVNLDDRDGRRLVQMIPETVHLVTFGRAVHADIRATEVMAGSVGTSMRIEWPGGSAKVRSRQIGNFSVSNILAAVATAYATGIDLNLVLPRLVSFAGTPGRMEAVDEGQPFTFLVDSAYTPEMARHALRAARDLGDGRLLVVFGCCGERDPSDRADLVEAIQKEADFCWATADNPRNEPLPNIFRDMRGGVLRPEDMAFIDDRRRAIALALDTALPGDVVLLLGKGHEPFQYVGDAAQPFDDRLVARELLALREVALTGLRRHD
jgi:UDP-N-acetylmuramoyl-L-alanyl-D-glutamate--2,6-diaminopimelate ligase